MPTKRLKSPTITPILAINAIAAVLFGLGYLMSSLGWNILLVPVGLAVLFLPGFNMTRTLELLTGSRQDAVTKTLWTIIASLTVTPAVGSIAILLGGGGVIGYGLPGFLAWWALSLIGVIILEHFSKLPTRGRINIDRKELLAVIGVFALSLAGALIIYPFIPEADSYTYLMRLRDIQASPTLFASEGRPLFLVLAQTFNSITGLSPYWLFKIGLPLLGVTMPLTAYLIVSSATKQRWLRIVLALSPLYFPVVFQELLISRPQSAFLIVVVPTLYLIGKLSVERSNPRHIYLLMLLTVIGGIGLKIHTLFALLLPMGLTGIVVFYAPRIIRRPIDALLISIVAIVTAYPWIGQTGVVADLGEVGRLFLVTAKNNHFVWWFLDNYRNVDGNEAGWPGVTALFYYGYNLGVFLPGFVILLLLQRRNKKQTAGINRLILWPFWATGIVFLIVGEIAPRFGFAYLPDRAWLMIALSLSLLVPYLAIAVINKPWAKSYQLVLAGLAVAAILSSWALSYVKDGWINAKDYAASSYLREQTPPTSVFLSQGSNHVLIRYFGERKMVRPLTDIFSTNDPNAVDTYLASVVQQRADSLASNAGRVAGLRKDLERVQEKITGQSREDPLLLAQRDLIQNQYEVARGERQLIYQDFVAAEGPIYILYSRNKFHSLYAQRAWWRSSNFADADLEKFSSRYPVVFNRNGVTIWKVRD